MTPEHEFVKSIVQRTKKSLKENELLLPIFFIGTEEKLDIVGTPFNDADQSKDQALAAVKKMAAEMNAEFVIFVTEAWSVRQQSAKEYEENRHKYKSVSEHPDAIDIVMFIIETKTSITNGMAEILPNREMGEITWMKPDSMEGRFANVLGEKPVRH